MAELERGEEPTGRVRRPGAGRKPVTRPTWESWRHCWDWWSRPGRGDPESALSWTTLSLQHLAAELTGLGHAASTWTVANLLREQGFSLQANAKTIEGRQYPDQDGQFCYLNARAMDHTDAGDPVISVDTKKKELVGSSRTAGVSGGPRASRSR